MVPSIITFQGVIFSITTSSRRKLLCSVSDDRSIRIWKVSSAETDLLLSDWSVSNWVSATFDLQHVLYGHTARVWRALLLDDWIISVGEVRGVYNYRLLNEYSVLGPSSLVGI